MLRLATSQITADKLQADKASPVGLKVAMFLFLDISVVDIGNYTCEVGGPQNTVLASVTHQLNVRGKCWLAVMVAAYTAFEKKGHLGLNLGKCKTAIELCGAN